MKYNSREINVSRFEWDASKFAPDFTITPTEGYIAQGMDVQFSITFRPLQVNSNIRYEVRSSLRTLFRPTVVCSRLVV